MQLSGRSLLHYQIVEPIAGGGMGGVYRALDTRTDRSVAIRVFSPEQVADPQARRRFEHEAGAASALNHPNICVIHEIAEDGPLYFVAMEDIEGQPLSALIAEQFSAAELLRYAIPIADALARAHAAGIIHRALKPSGIMLGYDGGVKLLDFGIAALAEVAAAIPAGSRPADAAMPADEETPSRSAGYLSPEQARGEPADHRSDIFSLGAILYEMATGRPAFAGPGAASTLTDEEPPPIREVVEGIPPALERIITKCLRKAPDARFRTVSELLHELKACRALLEEPPARTAIALLRRSRRPGFVVIALAVVGLASWFSVRAYRRHDGARWAATAGIAEVIALAGAGKINAAYAVAERIESFIPSDSRLLQQWPAIAREVTIETVPQGAEVYRKPFDQPDAPWEHLGRTPLQRIRVPRDLGRWRLEKSGFAAVEGSLIDGAAEPGLARVRIPLDRLEDAPAGMVRVPGTTDRRLDLLGYEGRPPRAVPDFWIDRHEVTNRQFKLFIDGGGYQQRELWTHPVAKAGATLSRRDAEAEFRDTTGRAAPAGWAEGDFPPDRADDPVGGVSWYEAGAYCLHAGKSLPTIWHWNSAAGIRTSAWLVPASNVGGRGPARVGSFPGLGPWGTYDLAGNVKEWSINPAPSDQRYVLGGGWRDPVHAFQRAETMDPLARQPDVGFRCVKYLSDTEPGAAAGSFSISSRDYAVERPCSDDLFRGFQRLYTYTGTPLHARIEGVEAIAGFRAERISFDAAGSLERVVAHLFLPGTTGAPVPGVVYLPDAEIAGSHGAAAFMPEFLLKSGRAVLVPELKGWFGRRDDRVADTPNASAAYRDGIIAWARNVRRSVDYLHTRPDIDTRGLAYVGIRLGAQLGPIMSAIEDRFSVNVWAFGGLKPQRSQPEVDSFHFAPRVRIPTLLLGGRYDFAYPLELAQVPLFRVLGVPAGLKRHVVFDSGYPGPPAEQARETIDWLDRQHGRGR
jgi:hypothetical protein